MASRRAGSVVLSFRAGTDQFNADITKINATVQNFAATSRAAGQHAGAGFVQASAAARLLEGNMSLNTRAFARFLSETLKLGPILTAAFPVIGAVMLVEAISRVAGEFTKFRDQVKNASKSIDDAFRAPLAGLRATNDELRVSTDKINIEIEKLEGKRENTMQLLLDEAKKSADDLYEALSKDVSEINKLMKEQDVSLLRRVLGEEGTSPVKKIFEDMSEAVNRINDKSSDQIAAINGLQMSAADRTKLVDQEALSASKLRTAEYQKAYDLTKKAQAESERLARGTKTNLSPNAGPALANAIGGLSILPGEGYPGLDTRAAQGMERAGIAALRALAAREEEQRDHDDAERRKQVAQAGADAEALGRPFADKLRSMRTESSNLDKQISSIGRSESFRVVAAGAEIAAKAIDEVNKRLESLHSHLSTDEESTLQFLGRQIAAKEAQKSWGEEVEKTLVSTRNRITEENALAAAVGKGYDAVKAVNVEYKVMSEVGSKYFDTVWMSIDRNKKAVSDLRSAFSSAFDSEKGHQIAEMTDKVNTQMKAEEALAQAYVHGAHAVQEAALNNKIAEFLKDNASILDSQSGAVRRYVEKLREEFDKLTEFKRSNFSDDLSLQAAAAERLARAIPQGTEATRQARIQNELLVKSRELGVSPDSDLMRQYKTRLEQEEQVKLTEEVFNNHRMYTNELAESVRKIEEIKRQIADVNTNEKVRRDLNFELRDEYQKELDILIQQTLAGRRIQDGIRAFFIEMQKDAKSAAQIVYDAFTSAIDRISGELAKLFSGQKTSFRKMLRGEAESVLKEVIQREMKGGLSKIGDVLYGKGGVLGKIGTALGGGPKSVPPGIDTAHPSHVRLLGPDGTAGAPFHVIIVGGTGGAGAGGLTLPESPNAGPLPTPPSFGGIGGSFGGGGGSSGGGGGGGGGWGQIIGAVVGAAATYGLGHKASGGWTSPDQAYLVGENGPEILAGANARVYSNNDTRRLLGSDGSAHTNMYIDARGTDPVLTAQRTKMAVEAAHRSAVKQSVIVHHERVNRMPMRAGAAG